MKTELGPIFFFTLQLIAATSIGTADTVFPLSETNGICLRFDTNISVNVQDAISNDFNKCLAAYATSLELYSPLDNPPNGRYLLDFFQPYGGFSAIEGIGPRFPEHGTYSNGVFTIDISYAFATNYQHQIDSTAAFSNEIAAAYVFIESLSPTNIQTKTDNDLLTMFLWKAAPPGQDPVAPEHRNIIARDCRNRQYFPPPLFGFHIWDQGPTNAPSYLWCAIPSLNAGGSPSHRFMIYFQKVN